MPTLLTTGRAAEELGLSRQTVKARIARGELPASRIIGVAGRDLYVLDAADIERHLEERGRGAPAGRPPDEGPKRLSDVVEAL